MKNIPFLTPDLPPWDEVRGELELVYRTGKFHPGQFTDRFEATVCSKLGCKHAVMVSTASDGLILLAMYARSLYPLAKSCTQPYILGPDFTFRATAQAAYWAHMLYGALESGQDGNVTAQTVNEALQRYGPRAIAIIGVHLFGLPCAAAQIEQVAVKAHVPVYYDAAHALGAKYPDGSFVGCGKYANAECFSLNITKAVPSCGEGGVITTNDEALATWLYAARWHGDKPGASNWKLPGMNAKPTEWQAIVAYHALLHMDDVIERRHTVAAHYRSGLARNTDLVPMQPVAPWPGRHGYKDFAILAKDVETRTKLDAALEAAGIQFKHYFDPLISDLEMSKFDDDMTPVAHDLSSRVICLPIGARLGAVDQERIIDALNGVR